MYSDAARVQENPVETAITQYHQIFGVPPTFPICSDALQLYAREQRVTLIFHTPAETGEHDAISIDSFNLVRILPSAADKKAILRQCEALPSIDTSPHVDWSNFSPDPARQVLLAKLFAICEARWRSVTKCGGAHVAYCDVEPHTILEAQLLLTYLPNAAYIALGMGDRMPGTNLRSIEKIFVVLDSLRPTVLN